MGSVIPKIPLLKPRAQRKPGLFLGGGLFGDDAIVLRGALHASANFFASWIISHRPEMVPAGRTRGKEFVG